MREALWQQDLALVCPPLLVGLPLREALWEPDLALVCPPLLVGLPLLLCLSLREGGGQGASERHTRTSRAVRRPQRPPRTCPWRPWSSTTRDRGKF